MFAGLLALSVSACEVESVSGPASVEIGSTVSYDVAISHAAFAPLPINEAVLMAEVPAGRTVCSATYSGEASGPLVESSTNPSTHCDFVATHGPAPAGMKQVCFSAPTLA